MQSESPKLATQSSPKPSRFHPGRATFYGLVVGLAGLVVLGYRLVVDLQDLPWLPILIFAGLSLLVQRSSFHLGSSVVHSLAGLIDVAAVLALGPIAGAIVASASGLAYLELNALRHQKLGRRDLLEIPLFNAGLKALIALTAGALFQALNGSLPLPADAWPPAPELDSRVLMAFGVVCFAWFVLDHVAWGILDFLHGGPEHLRLFIRSTIPNALLIELLPLFFGLIVAWVYVYLGWTAFAVLAIAIVAVSLLAQRLAYARNELVQRVAELSTVEKVGRDIAQAQLDVDELCKLLYESATEIADTTIFHLGLFDGDRYTLKLWMHEGQEKPPQTFQMKPGVGLINWMRESKQPLLIHDFQKEIDSLPAKPAYVSDHPPRSALFVPLIAGETVVGTMAVQSFRPGAYDDSDLSVLSAMANQAAVALQKAQLYARERKRVRQLETIGRVSRQVTAIMKLDELFRQVVNLVRESFGYYHVAIYTADPKEETVAFQASASAGGQDVVFDVEWGQGLIGWVAAHAQSVIINDVENEPRYRCIEALDETQSEMSVPLLLDQKVLGMLDVQSDQLGAFGPDDLFILETLGSQIAIAIHEARLYEAERQQAWLSTALLQVADAMSQVSDMDAVLENIVRLTPMLVGVDRCAILFWDPDTETFTPAQTHGLAPQLRATFKDMQFPMGRMPALDLVRWEKSPLLVSASDDRQLIPPDLAETFRIREMLLLPLLAQGELLGAMMVDFAGQAHPFNERNINMLSGIANQAAIVIQSARLVQAQREEAYVSLALLQVAEAVSGATELEETLATVVRITPILVGVEACAILLRDQEAGAFLPFQQFGLEREDQSAFWNLHLPEDRSPMQDLLDGVPYITLQDPGSEFAALGSGASSIAFPLTTKGEVQGAMIVNSTRRRQPTQQWMNILTGIAGQAAMAIENARLLREAAEQERMKQELEVARRIQTSFLPESSPSIPGWEVAVIWRSAREVGGDFYDFIPLPPGTGGTTGEVGATAIVIADVADKGVPAALFMALSRTLVRTMATEGLAPATTIGRANDLIVTDTQSDLFVTLFYAMLQPESGGVTYVNAGHMPPLLVRSASGTTEELWTEGMALGVLPGLEFEQRSVHLDPGDLLLLYTDGVTDASNAEGEMFGRERLVELAVARRSQSADELAHTIREAVASFAGDARQFDDLTLVVAKRSST